MDKPGFVSVEMTRRNVKGGEQIQTSNNLTNPQGMWTQYRPTANWALQLSVQKNSTTYKIHKLKSDTISYIYLVLFIWKDMFTCMQIHSSTKSWSCIGTGSCIHWGWCLYVCVCVYSCIYSYIFTDRYTYMHAVRMSPATRAIDLAACKFILKNETGYKIYVDASNHCFIVAATTKMIEWTEPEDIRKWPPSHAKRK